MGREADHNLYIVFPLRLKHLFWRRQGKNIWKPQINRDKVFSCLNLPYLGDFQTEKQAYFCSAIKTIEI